MKLKQITINIIIVLIALLGLNVYFDVVISTHCDLWHFFTGEYCYNYYNVDILPAFLGDFRYNLIAVFNILIVLSFLMFIISSCLKNEIFAYIAEILVIIFHGLIFLICIFNLPFFDSMSTPYFLFRLLVFIMLVISYFNVKKADFSFAIEKTGERQGETMGEIIKEKDEMGKTVFCKNCGKEMTEMQDYCLQCGVKAKSGKGYCRNCGTKLHDEAAICVSCGMLVEDEKKEKKSGKSKVTAGLLGLFLGGLGVHNFYLGYKGKAIAQLLLCWTGISAIWSLIESIMILTGSMNKDGEGNPLQ